MLALPTLELLAVYGNISPVIKMSPCTVNSALRVVVPMPI